MITKVDERLRREAGRFELRFRCEDCAHFEPERGSCGNGYPNEAHRAVELGTLTSLTFCKEFELA
jgi:hypothetical protein